MKSRGSKRTEMQCTVPSCNIPPSPIKTNKTLGCFFFKAEHSFMIVVSKLIEKEGTLIYNCYDAFKTSNQLNGNRQAKKEIAYPMIPVNNRVLVKPWLRHEVQIIMQLSCQFLISSQNGIHFFLQ